MHHPPTSTQHDNGQHKRPWRVSLDLSCFPKGAYQASRPHFHHFCVFSHSWVWRGSVSMTMTPIRALVPVKTTLHHVITAVQGLVELTNWETVLRGQRQRPRQRNSFRPLHFQLHGLKLPKSGLLFRFPDTVTLEQQQRPRRRSSF